MKLSSTQLSCNFATLLIFVVFGYCKGQQPKDCTCFFARISANENGWTYHGPDVVGTLPDGTRVSAVSGSNGSVNIAYFTDVSAHGGYGGYHAIGAIGGYHGFSFGGSGGSDGVYYHVDEGLARCTAKGCSAGRIAGGAGGGHTGDDAGGAGHNGAEYIGAAVTGYKRTSPGRFAYTTYHRCDSGDDRACFNFCCVSS